MAFSLVSKSGFFVQFLDANKNIHNIEQVLVIFLHTFLLQVYLTDYFDPQDDFTTYQEILNIPGDAASSDETYNMATIKTGRYAVFVRQELRGYLEFYDLKMFAPIYVE